MEEEGEEEVVGRDGDEEEAIFQRQVLLSQNPQSFCHLSTLCWLRTHTHIHKPPPQLSFGVFNILIRRWARLV